MYSEHKLPWLLRLDAGLLVSILFGLMLVCILLGMVIGRRRKGKFHFENPANNTLSGAVFGLLAFLLGFTFAMSGTRYDARRLAPVSEANDINAAILRADFFPDSDRLAFRNEFKDYLQARIDFMTAGADVKKLDDANKRAAIYATSLWSHLVEFFKRSPGSAASIQMMQALTSMFNSARSSLYDELMKVPQPIVIMLFVLALVAAFLVGYVSIGEGRLDWLIGVSFCLLTCLVIFITLNLDRERRGLIRVRTSDEAVLSLMKQLEQP